MQTKPKGVKAIQNKSTPSATQRIRTQTKRVLLLHCNPIPLCRLVVGFLVENMEKSASEFCINTQKSHKFCFSSSPWSLDYKMCHWNLLLTSTHTYWIFMHLRRLNRETYAVSKTNWFVAVNQYNCFFIAHLRCILYLLQENNCVAKLKKNAESTIHSLLCWISFHIDIYLFCFSG